MDLSHSNSAREQALAFWYGRINYEQHAPAPSDLKLDRMRALLRLLGDPHRSLRIVHVAGSKGKGSTSAMLEAILRRAGYRTGLFTSPHLVRVEERFEVDGTPIDLDELTVLLQDIRNAVAGAGPSGMQGLTFFEIATAVGFLYFVRRRVEAAVIEVGLGGRYDSTNVCLPAVSLITSISFDHTRLLGDRLASIAGEKAGIVKPGRPVISGATAPEARQVIARVCQERRSPLRELGKDYHYRYQPGWIGPTTARGSEEREPPPAKRNSQVQVVTPRRTWPFLELGLLGEHQAANAAGVIACVEELREQGWHISDAAVAAGLANVQWPARMEVIAESPLVILDCAHNVASAQAVVDTLQASFGQRRRWLVFAGSNDKDLPGMLAVLAPHFNHAFLTQYQDNPRGVPTETLAQVLGRVSRLPFITYATPLQAWQAASKAASRDDLICITGSVFLAGELRPILKA
jgi:dihydrofolate synthase/folylpolyglutamate synthase